MVAALGLERDVDAERGEEVVITRHNKPVAKLVPLDGVSAELVQQRRQALAELQEIGQAVAGRTGVITRDEIVDWIREGRR